jgi:NADP-dependent aldehyde dehydrogenase
VLRTTANAIADRPGVLLRECFGPATLIIEYASIPDLRSATAALSGSLTATIHAEPDDDIDELCRCLRALAGRLLFNSWPTGVAVMWAQHHVGPYPATTNQLHTSVGAAAVTRFTRPVAYQNAPQHVLPPELRDENPLGLMRRVNGRLCTGPVEPVYPG